MTKELVKKIAMAGFGLAMGGLISSCGENHETGGLKVKSGLNSNDITEYKGQDIIIYSANMGMNDDEIYIFINGKKYTKKDTLIYQEAIKRYTYLKGKIDSIKYANDNLEMQYKLEKEKEEENKVLDILRR